jgi:hypothetical protein
MMLSLYPVKSKIHNETKSCSCLISSVMRTALDFSATLYVFQVIAKWPLTCMPASFRQPLHTMSFSRSLRGRTRTCAYRQMGRYGFLSCYVGLWRRAMHKILIIAIHDCLQTTAVLFLRAAACALQRRRECACRGERLYAEPVRDIHANQRAPDAGGMVCAPAASGCIWAASLVFCNAMCCLHDESYAFEICL